MNKDTLNLLLLAALGVAAYYLFKKLPNVTAPIVNPLADWYVWLTGSGQTIPTGQILLPDGVTSVPVANVSPRIIPGTNTAAFSYQGVTYYLCTQSDANGNWAAQTSPC